MNKFPVNTKKKLSPLVIMSKLTFEWGRFTYDRKVIDQFDDFLRTLRSSRLGGLVENTEKIRNALIQYCSRFTAEHPEFLDAYAITGDALFEDNQIEEAMVWYQRGLEASYKAVPIGFKGEITWMYYENRPFLELHRGIILCHSARGNIKEAIQQAEYHLTWNPNDDIYVRDILADLYVVDQQATKARKLMKRTKGMRLNASHCYNRALLYFRDGKYHNALTELRLGFIKNSYIAQILLGNEVPLLKKFKVGFYDESTEYARDYAGGIVGKEWKTESYAVDFLNWAYNCSVTLQDRSDIMNLCKDIDDVNAKDSAKLNRACRSFITNINLKSSKKMNINIDDIHVGPTHPWLIVPQLRFLIDNLLTQTTS